MTTMYLSYRFKKDGNVYEKISVDIGETCDIEAEAEYIEGLKMSAICHEFNLPCETLEEFEEQNINIDDFEFEMCELEME